MERVSIILGNYASNVLVIAPHGYDDDYTDIMAESITKNLNCYAVINRGWERSETVDFLNDKANCNNTLHIHEDVVKEEFLDPILNYKTQILFNHPCAYIFLIHGFITVKNRPDADVILGYGAGNNPSLSIELWRRNAMIYFLESKGFEVFAGAGGGQFAARKNTNLNQLFRHQYRDTRVQSVQMEISKDWRMDEKDAFSTGKIISDCIQQLVNLGACGFSRAMNIKEC